MSASPDGEALFLSLSIKEWVTVAGIVISLGLGLYNLRTTKRIRSGTIVIEELRSQVRDPVQKKLDALLEAKNSFAALGKPNGLKIEELRAKISDVVSEVEFLLLDIGVLLKQADTSQFAKGSNWESSYRSQIDEIQAEADKLAAPKVTAVQVGGCITTINFKIDQLNQDIRKRLEDEVRRHLPA